MKRRIYILLPVLFVLLFSNCSKEDNTIPEPEAKFVTFKLQAQGNINPLVVDEDNLAVEQTINDISIFMTDPASNTITNRFVHTEFSTVDDYKLITLPPEAVTLQTKDIYVIANFDDVSTLNSIQSVADFEELQTPAIDDLNPIIPGNGICMYGTLPGFDFVNSSNHIIPINILKTYAKVRINLSFPNNPGISTNNSFLIQNAARFTYVASNTIYDLDPADYFSYTTPISLIDNGSGTYINFVYLYESTLAPTIHFYAQIQGINKDYVSKLPVLNRNYFYDLQVKVYPLLNQQGIRSTGADFTYTTTIKVYDENGNPVDYTNE